MTAYLTTAHPLLAARTGAGVRIAIVDSGAAEGHPHVGALAAGVSLVGEDPLDTADRVGHGTAVAAAIREKAPNAALSPVRVLDRQLATSARVLASAIDWAVEAGVHLVNLSLGTTNPDHIPRFAESIARARAQGVLVVSAFSHDGVSWYPGALRGALGVIADASVPRDALALRRPALGGAAPVTLAASPYPRPIPGVPAERNLWGVSFAVANVTGLLALALEAGAPPGDPEGLVEWLATHAVPPSPEIG